MAVFAGISMSLDGFVAGPHIGSQHPMGEGGMRLHQWMFEGKTDRDEEIVRQRFETSGAVVMGRRTFDVGIDLWGDDGAFGMPCFVVTHHPRERLARGPTTFDFVTGIEEAVQRAQTAAGKKKVWVMGGAQTIRQSIGAGLVDELQINLVPSILGKGTRLFEEYPRGIELERLPVIETPGATHLHYRILK
jgi:dihydrofolate reductase